MKKTTFITCSFLYFFSTFANAQQTASNKSWWVQSEIGSTWQTVNSVQIPSQTGTRFSLVDLGGKGPALSGRIYLGYKINERHELRALYAPLSISLNGTSSQPISFQGSTFTQNAPIDAKYTFNSYRLTYRYVFFTDDRWTLRVGFTAKIRDAEIKLSQGGVTASRANTGFVPLAHFSAVYRLCSTFNLHFDADALAAPQGRAEDVALFAGYAPNESAEFLLGYRTVEGGSSGTGSGGVYNFTWLHTAVAGMIYKF